jgi:glucose-1-phosphate cytidylyltransferase
MMAKDPSTGPITRYGTDGQTFTNVDESEPTPEQEPTQILEPVGEGVKVVILAGGRGTRLMDETHGTIPKPLVEVGGVPMIEHIMRIYSCQGFGDFIIAAGYLGEKLEEWAWDNKERLAEFSNNVTVIDTGEETQTGSRLLRLQPYLEGEEFFLMTYGDGLADVNIAALLEHHRMLQQAGRSKAQVTLTAARPPARFGNLLIDHGFAVKFGEKSQSTVGWINAGFYIIKPEVLNIVPSKDTCKLEYDILPVLAMQERLGAYQHPGYFQMCDTWRDLKKMNDVWEAGNAPWARWWNGE